LRRGPRPERVPLRVVALPAMPHDDGSATIGTPRQSPALYDVDQAADLCGLSPETITTYAKRGKLERGRDYVLLTWYYGRYRRRSIRITRRGILRLILRNWTSEKATRPRASGGIAHEG
jgi:hypothetical protein